jgi:hypothetical protein
VLAQKQSEFSGPGNTFELGGDKVGESFADFVSHHPKAKGIDSTTAQRVYALNARSSDILRPFIIRF